MWANSTTYNIDGTLKINKRPKKPSRQPKQTTPDPSKCTLSLENPLRSNPEPAFSFPTNLLSSLSVYLLLKEIRFKVKHMIQESEVSVHNVTEFKRCISYDTASVDRDENSETDYIS